MRCDLPQVLPAIEGRRFDVIDCAATPRLPFYATWLGGGWPRVRSWLHGQVRRQWPTSPAAWSRGPRGRLARPCGALGAPSCGGDHRGRLKADPGRIPVRPGPCRGQRVGTRRIRTGSEVAGGVGCGSPARLIPENGVDRLIEAVAQRPSLPTLRCLVIGDGHSGARSKSCRRAGCPGLYVGSWATPVGPRRCRC